MNKKVYDAYWASQSILRKIEKSDKNGIQIFREQKNHMG